MKILVVSSCSSQKSVDHPRRLTHSDFKIGPERVLSRESEMAHALRPAEDLYAGLQHKRLMCGIRSVRNNRAARGVDVDLWILSAGYGMIPAARHIAPYDVTFNTMTRAEARAWAERQGVPSAFRDRLASAYDLCLVLLGSTYLDVCQIGADLKMVAPTVFLTSAHGARRMSPVISEANFWPLTNSEARHLSCPLVGIKGEVVARLLMWLNEGRILVPPTSLGEMLSLFPPDECLRRPADAEVR